MAVPERFRKFVEQAVEMMPRLDPAAAQKLKAAVDALHAAARMNDNAQVEAAGNALMDTLFDVRP